MKWGIDMLDIRPNEIVREVAASDISFEDTLSAVIPLLGGVMISILLVAGYWDVLAMKAHAQGD